MEPTLTDIVSHTRELLNAVRGSLIRVAQNLAVIRESLPADTNFGKFVEEEFGLSSGMASKLLTVNRVYLIDGGLVPEDIEDVDMEKLYLSRGLEGTAEEKAAKARTLTRADIRAEFQDDKPHEFESKEICRVCGASRENHL